MCDERKPIPGGVAVVAVWKPRLLYSYFSVTFYSVRKRGLVCCWLGLMRHSERGEKREETMTAARWNALRYVSLAANLGKVG